MTDRDLTPDVATHDTPYGASEARAEIEAFLGPEWTVDVPPVVSGHLNAWRGGVDVHAFGDTYRAAVDALKQAWRDAVRPWMEAAIEAKLDTADVDGYAPNERVIARVLKEDSK